MKWIVILVLVPLTAVLLWLGFNQRRVQEKLAVLEAESQRLTAEAAQKSDTSAEDKLREAEARLGQAQLALAATEQRLGNMAAQLEAIHKRLQSAPPRPPRRRRC